MKKLFAFALTFVLLFAVAAPALAASRGDVASPDALCNGNHMLYVAEITERYSWVNNSTCHVYRVYYYMCQNCHYTQDVAESYDTTHSSYTSGARCNGSTQTLDKACRNCGHGIGYTTKPCPGAYHSGTCLWLPT